MGLDRACRIGSGAFLVAGGTFTGGICLQAELCVVMAILSQAAEENAEVLGSTRELSLAVELLEATLLLPQVHSRILPRWHTSVAQY